MPLNPEDFLSPEYRQYLQQRREPLGIQAPPQPRPQLPPIEQALAGLKPEDLFYPEPGGQAVDTAASLKGSGLSPPQPQLPPPPTDWGGVASDIGQGIVDLPTHVKGSFAGSLQPRSDIGAPGVLQEWIDQSRSLARKRREEDVPGGSQVVVPGLNITRQDVRDFFPNFAFSTASGLEGLAGAVLGSKVPGLRGTKLGPAISGLGTSAYSAGSQASNQLLQDVLEAASQGTGRKLTDPERVHLLNKFGSAATEHGLWEAIPEMAGNALALRQIMKPLQKSLTGAFGHTVGVDVLKRLAKMYGMEIGTEAITETGQHNVAVQAGLQPGPERSFLNPSDWGKSIGEVAPATILNTTVTGGLGLAGRGVYDMLQNARAQETLRQAVNEASGQQPGAVPPAQEAGQPISPPYTSQPARPLPWDQYQGLFLPEAQAVPAAVQPQAAPVTVPAAPVESPAPSVMPPEAVARKPGPSPESPAPVSQPAPPPFGTKPGVNTPPMENGLRQTTASERDRLKRMAAPDPLWDESGWRVLQKIDGNGVTLLSQDGKVARDFAIKNPLNNDEMLDTMDRAIRWSFDHPYASPAAGQPQAAPVAHAQAKIQPEGVQNAQPPPISTTIDGGVRPRVEAETGGVPAPGGVAGVQPGGSEIGPAETQAPIQDVGVAPAQPQASIQAEQPAANERQLVPVRDVYGDVHHVLQSQLNDEGKLWLRTYTPDGGRKAILQRANIAKSDADLIPLAKSELDLKAAGYEISARQPKSPSGEARLTKLGYQPYLTDQSGVISPSPLGVWARPPSGQKPIMAAKNRTPVVDPEKDSLLTAIAKLGGVNKIEAEQQGVDPAYSNHLGHRIYRTFNGRGRSFDHMAETLQQYGYPVTDADGRYNPNVLLEHVTRELSGNKVYSNRVNPGKTPAGASPEYHDDPRISDSIKESLAQEVRNDSPVVQSLADAIARAQAAIGDEGISAIEERLAGEMPKATDQEFNAKFIEELENATTNARNEQSETGSAVGQRQRRNARRHANANVPAAPGAAAEVQEPAAPDVEAEGLLRAAEPQPTTEAVPEGRGTNVDKEAFIRETAKIFLDRAKKDIKAPPWKIPDQNGNDTGWKFSLWSDNRGLSLVRSDEKLGTGMNFHTMMYDLKPDEALTAAARDLIRTAIDKPYIGPNRASAATTSAPQGPTPPTTEVPTSEKQPAVPQPEEHPKPTASREPEAPATRAETMPSSAKSSEAVSEPPEGEAKPEPGNIHSARSALAKDFQNGRRFNSIVEARKRITELTGASIKAGTEEAKTADETIEQAGVIAARAIVDSGQTPEETFDQLSELADRIPRLGVRTSSSIAQQAYSTPLPLAYVASRRAGVAKAKGRVLEPTAGNGALLLEAAPAIVDANELNPSRAEFLREQGFKATQEDSAMKDFGRGAEVVIANPPFGASLDQNGETRRFQITKEYSTNEIDHAISLNALDGLDDNGRAVLIIGAPSKTLGEKARSDAYNGLAKRSFFYTLYNDYKVTDHFTVSGELYAKQGAAWPVDVVVIDGRGKSSLSLPSVALPRVINSIEELKHELYPAKAKQEATADRQPSAESIAEGKRDPGTNAGASQKPELSRARGRDTNQQLAGVRGVAVRESPVARSAGTALADTAATKLPGSGRLGSRPDTAEGVVSTFQSNYKPASKAKSVGTLVPKNMASAVTDAMDDLQKRRGLIDAYVAKQLDYSQTQLREAFSAEQIDALGLALDAIESGKGFIIGDQTGVGKGRVVAGIIRYALKHGQTPIFVTEKPNLYGDMLRDLRDIGMEDVRPIVTNSGFSIPLDETAQNWFARAERAQEEGTPVPAKEGKFLATPGGAPHQAALARMNESGQLEKGDVIFTTYNQMQTVRGELTTRMDFLSRFADGGILIFDESHNAGGQDKASRGSKEDVKTGRAAFSRDLARKAAAVLYSSATYAKRPEVMDLYFRTDMGSGLSASQLRSAMESGGVPLQQVVATMLTRAGQYLRREKSFAGIEYRTAEAKVDHRFAENASTIMRDIMRFDTMKQAAVDGLDKEMKSQARVLSGDKSTGGAGAMSTNFTSVMHNLISQMLLTLKVKPALEEALSALRNGEKPVIALSNTMGSAIEEYADEMGIKPGDGIGLSFGDLLRRYLEKSRRVIEGDPFGKKTSRMLSDAELGPAALDHYHNILKRIDAMGFGNVPISPIDALRQGLAEHGYSVGEITGRQSMIDYSGETPRYRRRPAKEISPAGRRVVVDQFNSGKLDAIILNQSGATGLSLHASERFGDQRKRMMLIVQPELNIDTHMQMLGRINRTGQVVLPRYVQMVADIPAEKRPAAILAKKMAALNANTTASRESALKAKDVPDFMNLYGDQVAASILGDNPIWHAALGNPLHNATTGEGLETEDAIRKVSGRIPVLPLKEQEALYGVLEEAYAEYLEQLNRMGENQLEAKTLDLDARTMRTTEVLPATGKTENPFQEGVRAETLDVKRLGKPLTKEQIIQEIARFVGAASEQDVRQARSQWKAAQVRSLNEATDAYLAQISDRYSGEDQQKRKEAELSRIKGQKERIDVLFEQYHPGTPVRVEAPSGTPYLGYVGRLERKGKTENPVAPSSWRVTIYVADAAKQITVPLSRILPSGVDLRLPGYWKMGMSEVKAVNDALEEQHSHSREERVMVVGNLLAGFGAFNRGQIVHFQRQDGGIDQGILMPRDFDLGKEMDSKAVSLSTAEAAEKFLSGGKGLRLIQTSDGRIRLQRLNNGDFMLAVPSSKREGGRYFLHGPLINAAGRGFVQIGENMRVSFGADRLPDVVRVLYQDLGTELFSTSDKEEAREAVASTPRFSLSERHGGLSVAEIQAHLNQMPASKTLGATINVVANESHLPSAIKREIARQKAEGRVGGVYHGGQLYLVASNIRTLEQVEETILHELTHLGVRKLYGPNGVQALRLIYNAVGGDEGIRALAKSHGFNMEEYFKAAEERYQNDPLGRRILLADELLAHLNQHGPKSLPAKIIMAVRQFIGAVKAWLRQQGLAELAKWSDSDLAHELRRIMEAAKSEAAATTAAGTRFLFLGPKAKRANLLTKAAAEKYIERGADAETVRQATGWYRDVDGKWKFEISDEGASLTLAAEDRAALAAGRAVDTNLGDLLEHKTLFANYPELRDIRVTIDPSKKDGGVFNERNRTITLGVSPTDEKTLSYLLHEVQHGVQSIEGFARGTSPAAVIARAFDTDEDIARVAAAYKSELSGEIPQAWVEKASAATKDRNLALAVKYRDAAENYAAYQVYRRIAGEIEARNVQERMGMTAQERKQTPIAETADVPLERAIVLFRNRLAAAMSVEEPTSGEISQAKAQRQAVETKYADILRAHDEKGEPLTAPNGKPSNLNREQWIQVRTPAFKEWFGPWDADPASASKVVDENGEPRVVYHGSPSGKFNSFDTNKKGARDSGWFGAGFYFSGDQRQAEIFSKANRQRSPEKRIRPYVAHGYLSVRNPLDIATLRGHDIRKLVDASRQKIGREQITDAAWSKYAEEIKAVDSAKNLIEKSYQLSVFGDIAAMAENSGHDGIVAISVEGDTFVAFSPTQIKSATSNIGTYSSANPDIRFSFTNEPDTETRYQQDLSAQTAILADRAHNSGYQSIDEWAEKQPAQFLAAAAQWRDEHPMRFSIAAENTAHPGAIGGLAERVRDTIADWLTYPGSESRPSWWDKSVGTMRNLAKKNTEFKRFLDLIERSHWDATRLASHPEKLAPLWFRDMSGVRAALHTGNLSSADQKILSSALNAITTGEKRRYDITTEQGKAALAEHGITTDTQRQAYDQAMKAIELATDQSSRSFMVRLGQAHHLDHGMLLSLFEDSRDIAELHQNVSDLIKGEGMSPEVIGQDTRGNQVYSLQWLNDAKKANELAIKNLNDAKASADEIKPYQEKINDISAMIEGHQKLLKQLQDLKDKTGKLKFEGYVPLMRFGKYTVTAVDENGQHQKDLPFLMFETQHEANRMARELTARGFRIKQETMNPDLWKMFEGISPETMAAFAEFLPEDMQELTQQWIKHAVADQSALKRLLHRNEVPGWYEDSQRVIAQYLVSSARLASRNLHAGEIDRAVRGIHQGDAQQQAQRLVEYLKDPTEEFPRLRNFLFFWYLGMSVSSAITNLTQPILTTVPFLSQYGASAAGVVGKWMAKVPTGVIPERYKADVQRGAEEGLLAPQEIYNLMATARGGTLGGGKLLRTRFVQVGLQVWGSLFAMAEQFNRRVTFLSALEMAESNPAILKQAGVKTAYDFAKLAVDDSQFAYSRWNRPVWARGAAAPLFTFKQFTIQYLEFLRWLPMPQRILALSLLVLAAGVKGVPGEEDAEDIIDTFGQWTGHPMNSRAWLVKNIHPTVLNGLQDFGLPFDIQSRLGLGNLIPGTGALIPSNRDKSGDVAEVFGAAGQLVQSAVRTTEAATKGETRAVIANALPRAVASWLQSIDMAVSGIAKDQQGKKITEATGMDVVSKFMNFTPRSVSRSNQAGRLANEIRDYQQMREDEFADKLARARIDGDQATYAKIQAERRAWNVAHPDMKIFISPSQIRQRVMAIRATKEGRVLKTLPREIRGEGRKIYDEVAGE